jgi:hypothetical protein
VWYIPSGVETSAFRRWLPPAILPGPGTHAHVLALPEPCYRCGGITRSIVGVLVSPALTADPDGFVGFEEIAEGLASVLSEEWLLTRNIGRLARRWSDTVRRVYMSNGCIHCGALQGNFPLRESLLEFRTDGGSYEGLVVGEMELPLAALTADALQPE